ncbi:Ig-like domain-containing protein [Alteromonas sp. ASW11-130]|uniref:Ig-like domain-containing protein n=1 Tax=Alteromonas sp. ASW11-130 TaxID=3015775 RepID=UPI002241FF42|nr:Ig-like domain-containing protein [Alteromonas sp. ASW11-130]MCW8091018.1 Ig-like domain-containing protein [Alteromonas sp. ASW11-130]
MMLKPICLLALCYIVLGCGGSAGDSGSTKEDSESTPPLLVSPKLLTFSPKQNAYFVKPDATIKATFDIDVNPETIEKAFSISPSISGSHAYNMSTKQVTFTPDETLAYSKQFTVTFNTALESQSGGKLEEPISIRFTTAGQADPMVTTEGRITVAVLDMSSRNGESKSDFNSLSQALNIAGVTFNSVEDIDNIEQPQILFVTSYLNNDTLSDREKSLLREYVQNGGTLIARTVKDEALLSLFGVAAYATSTNHTSITFERSVNASIFKYIDSPIEHSISVGKTGQPRSINSISYSPTSGETIARFNDTKAAFIRNHVVDGTAYLLGVSYNDLVQRNFYNLDYSAQRGGLNEQENSTDTFILFLRAILESHLPNFVWKHSSPGNSQSTLLVTHDIDSQTGAELAANFASFEKEAGIVATFNVTTHYIDDAIDGDYYSMNVETYESILSHGHEIASHSVGHFRDFDDGSTVPKGSFGNSAASYLPYNNGEVTTGATVFGELEVSKTLLQNDLHETIRVFRSGHLLWNRHQAEVLEKTGYRYDSSFNGQDSLTSFPFRMPYDKKLSAELSSIYVFPVTLSDAISSDVYSDVTVQKWLDVFKLNHANSSPTVLLIHPNRESKLEELKAFHKKLPSDTATLGMEEFGDFWRARESIGVAYSIKDNTMHVALDEPLNALPDGFSIIINKGSLLHNLIVTDSTEAHLLFDAELLSLEKLVIYNFRSE